MKALLAEGINRPRKGHDAGDHPPITPMRTASEAELGLSACDFKLLSIGNQFTDLGERTGLVSRPLGQRSQAWDGLVSFIR